MGCEPTEHAAAAIRRVRRRVQEAQRDADEIVARAKQLIRDSTIIIERHVERLSAPVTAAPDLECAVEAVLDAAISMHCADFGNLQLFDPRKRVLEIVAQRGFGANFLQAFRYVSAGDGTACGRALRACQPILVEDVTIDTEFAPYRAVAADAGFRAVQSSPLIAGTGEFVGMLSTHFVRPRPLSEVGMQTTRLYARRVADIIARLAPRRDA